MKPMALKLLRIEKGLTQAEMAKVIGLGTAAYSRREADIKKLNVYEIEALTKFFELEDREAVEIFLPFKLAHSQQESRRDN